GVLQEGQQWGAEHAPEIDAFAANEIEVIRGPGTLLYGSGAIGGVVRVQPKALPTGVTLQGEIASNAFANNRQGALSLMVEGGHLAVPFAGQFGWRLQATARKAGDARAPNYFLPNTGFREMDYSAATGITRSWGTSTLTLSHFGTDLGLYIGAHVGNLDDLERAMRNAFTTDSFSYRINAPKQSVTHDVVAWNANLRLSSTSHLEASYGYQLNDRREFDSRGFAAGTRRPAFALKLHTHSVDLKYHRSWTDWLTGIAGVSGMRQGNLSPGRSFLIPQYRLYSGGAFALQTAKRDRLSVTTGLRLDYRYQHAYQYGAPVVVSPDDVRSNTGVSGTLGGTLAMTESWSVSGTAATAWRAPNANERFSQGVHHGTAQYEIGDSTLTPERSYNLEGTLRHAGVRSRFELSAFANRIDGFIFLQPRAPVITVRGTYPAYNYASDNALLRGGEATLELVPAAWLQLYANVNVVRGIDRATSTPLYDMPADRATASVRLFTPTSNRFVAPYLEVGTTVVRKQDHLPAATIYRLPTTGYGLLNFELGASAIRLGRVTLQPNITVRNVLDRRYRDYLSRYRLFVDDVGRDVVLRITAPLGSDRRRF
ncbi:MAG: TonB-dependent receptor, partial [Phycisphaerae bacterium]|nr:TonB-dependent receptor [Gemmatimonadaceae bacterium]